MLAAPVQHGFSIGEALGLADRILSLPPARRHIVRVAGVGRCVARFVLPLDLAKPQNRVSHGRPWQYARDKSRVAAFLAAQHGPRRAPLPGRPMVRCIRFSSAEPDRFNDGAKMAIDVLCAPSVRASNRLNFITDDRPSEAQIEQWWEPAPQGRGCLLLEVWTGGRQ